MYTRTWVLSPPPLIIDTCGTTQQTDTSTVGSRGLVCHPQKAKCWMEVDDPSPTPPVTARDLGREGVPATLPEPLLGTQRAMGMQGQGPAPSPPQ